MREIELDGRQMENRRQAHRYLSERLDLPDYYGHNLDALYDCLSTLPGQAALTLRHAEALGQNLGMYGSLMLYVLQQAARENPRLHLVLEVEDDEVEADVAVPDAIEPDGNDDF